MDPNTHEKEISKRTMDIFDMGIYVIEAAVVVAVIYAIVAFPAWLSPAT